MRHLHIFDPQLADYRGHYFHYCEQAVLEARRRGAEVSVYARRTCQVSCAGLTPAPLFTHDIFAEVGRDEQVWAMENFHAINQAFFADLNRVDTAGFTAEDVLFFPTLLQNQLYAIAQWVGRIPADRRPAVVVLLRYLTPVMDYIKIRPHHELVALYYRYGAQALLAAQPRTILCADTREMAAAFQRLIGRPVLELPIAMDAPAGRPAALPPGRPTVAFPGHTSQLKGFHFLPEIVLRCAELDPRPQFVVQVQNRQAAIRDRLEPVLQAMDRLVGPDVRLINGALDTDGYYELIGGADIVLLPYSPSYYGHCSSGVFAEAASMGRVMVVPAGTVAARQGREFGLAVVEAEAWTAPALAEAVAAALRNLPALKARAADAADNFRRAQSVEAFWDRLLAALPPLPASLAA